VTLQAPGSDRTGRRTSVERKQEKLQTFPVREREPTEEEDGMAIAVAEGSVPVERRRRKSRTAGLYPSWFYLPAAIVFAVLFMLPTFASLFFSLTRWSLQKAEFIGLDNFVQFFREPFLFQGLINTLIYGVVTSAS
jgi:raffinose/stachyose/melibiose transport system permease protein